MLERYDLKSEQYSDVPTGPPQERINFCNSGDGSGGFRMTSFSLSHASWSNRTTSSLSVVFSAALEAALRINCSTVTPFTDEAVRSS